MSLRNERALSRTELVINLLGLLRQLFSWKKDTLVQHLPDLLCRSIKCQSGSENTDIQMESENGALLNNEIITTEPLNNLPPQQ